MKRVLVTGSRKYTDKARVEQELLSYAEPLQVIHGGATGADTLADEVAREQGWPDPIVYPVTKAEWTRLGPKAGPLRNQRMYDETKPDEVVAFPLADSKGTRGMIEIARRGGTPVKTIHGPNRPPQSWYDAEEELLF